jgi:hypothetical protein
MSNAFSEVRKAIAHLSGRDIHAFVQEMYKLSNTHHSRSKL